MSSIPANAAAAAAGTTPPDPGVDTFGAEAAPPELAVSLRRMALDAAGAAATWTPLAGGVSSDIYRVDVGGRSLCVKRALARLKVAADWQAPVARNRYEVAWMRVAARTVPAAVPEVLGDDPEAGSFAMAFLPPDRYPVWKALLRDGVVDAGTAAAVGTTLGRIHAATADRPEIAAAFATDAIFHAIRLEPYLVATALRHPDLADRLHRLVATTATTRRVLVHGDFSPKNLLVGPDGPVILDAECAWFGDPAFDLAFVLNHLLLKCLWKPAGRVRYLAAYAALARAYLAHVAWEPAPAMAARTAALLPGLLLARIDGKSPVEYLTADADRQHVRAVARKLLVDPARDLETLLARWAVEDRG